MEKPNTPNNNPKMPKFNMTWIYILIAISIGVFFYANNNSEAGASVSVDKDYTTFIDYVEKGYGTKVVINNNEKNLKMYINKKHIQDVFQSSTKQLGPDPYIKVEIGSVDNLESFLNNAVKEKKITGFSYDNHNENTFLDILISFAPWILIILFWMWIMNRGAGGAGGVFNVGKSKARLYEKANNMGITFKDVAGQAGAKQEVQEIVEFLKNPQKYTDLGGKIPKGALLVGPPGTGKTLLAKAVAGEAGVPFFSMSGSDFVEMFVGVGASRVRDVFRQAKEKSPCIIFIDEIDAVGRARSKNPAMGGNDERENTLNALLTEMDGFGTNSGVIVLAATNRVDMLDSALLRAGRFDRQIHVDLPDLSERKAIFNVHLKGKKIDETVDVDLLSRQTPGFSGADIGSIAIHEAGHATISWFCRYANPLIKVTIVPRGQALGAAWYLPEERTITTKEQMLDEMCSLLGGRAAEELFTGHISTGAMNDLERATKSAFGMIAYAGMSDKLPNICYYNNSEYQFQRPYSDTTAKLIDDEVLKMVNEQYARAKEILSEHKDGHNELAELLISREVIFAEDVEKIFGKRPWVSRSQEIMEANEAIAQDGSEGAREQEGVDTFDEEPRFEDMPEAVKLAQAEFEQSSENTDQSDNSEQSENTANS